MKVTNVSLGNVYLKDLKVTHESQTEGRRGEDRYLMPGGSAYLPNTSEVLRSVIRGDIRKFRDAGSLTLEDTVTLSASGGGSDTIVLTHNFSFAPIVYVLKQVSSTWVDAIGTYDASHNASFTTTTISNTTSFALTFLIRLV